VETRNQERAAGATEKQPEAEAKGKIVDFMWKLKKEGYSDVTISIYGYILKNLLKKGADLHNPENVKEIIAVQKCSAARKSVIVKAYALFIKYQGLKWNPPKYKHVEKLQFIPTEKDIDDLIAGCNGKIAAFLQLIKETAIRRGEAFNLKWTDIDLINNTVRISPEKGSNPRIFKMPNRLAIMLNNMPKKSEKVFSYRNIICLERLFRQQRAKVARKLANPRILQIHFHTLRHWKATMEYAKTKDILYVMQLLGHKSIKNTLKYTQLINFESEEYVCKAATTTKEAAQLVEAGFQYICTTPENVMLFRKRK
jgi:integrase